MQGVYCTLLTGVGCYLSCQVPLRVETTTALWLCRMLYYGGIASYINPGSKD